MARTKQTARKLSSYMKHHGSKHLTFSRARATRMRADPGSRYIPCPTLLPNGGFDDAAIMLVSPPKVDKTIYESYRLDARQASDDEFLSIRVLDLIFSMYSSVLSSYTYLYYQDDPRDSIRSIQGQLLWWENEMDRETPRERHAHNGGDAASLRIARRRGELSVLMEESLHAAKERFNMRRHRNHLEVNDLDDFVESD